MATKIRFTRLGKNVDGTLEGSCGVMDVMVGDLVTTRLVVDCGSIPRPGVNPLDTLNLNFFKGGKPIDAVFITHSHGDHCGLVPCLVPFLAPNAKIFGTTSTIAALRETWTYELRDLTSADGKLKLSYDATAITVALGRLSAILTAGAHKFLGLETLVWPAGHMHGACSYTFRIGGHHVHYAGDTCDHAMPGLDGRKPLPEGWSIDIAAGVDCTYGASGQTPSWADEAARLIREVRAALEAGQKVMFFAFGQERGGAIAELLSVSGIAADFPVYMDGACRVFTQLFTSDENLWSRGERAFQIKGVKMIKDWKERLRIARSDKPYVIIAAPGMGGPGGVSGAFWRQQNLPNRDALVAFSGFVAPGTDGHQILAKAAERSAKGGTPFLTFVEQTRENPESHANTMPLRAQVDQYRIGGHNSQELTYGWFAENRPKIAILCHGDQAAIDRVERHLEGLGIKSVRADQTPSVTLTLED
jgi:Cft2 family RNA processing exonuclease